MSNKRLVAVAADLARGVSFSSRSSSAALFHQILTQFQPFVSYLFKGKSLRGRLRQLGCLRRFSPTPMWRHFQLIMSNCRRRKLTFAVFHFTPLDLLRRVSPRRFPPIDVLHLPRKRLHQSHAGSIHAPPNRKNRNLLKWSLARTHGRF